MNALFSNQNPAFYAPNPIFSLRTSKTNNDLATERLLNGSHDAYALCRANFGRNLLHGSIEQFLSECAVSYLPILNANLLTRQNASNDSTAASAFKKVQRSSKAREGSNDAISKRLTINDRFVPRKISRIKIVTSDHAASRLNDRSTTLHEFEDILPAPLTSITSLSVASHQAAPAADSVWSASQPISPRPSRSQDQPKCPLLTARPARQRSHRSVSGLTGLAEWDTHQDGSRIERRRKQIREAQRRLRERAKRRAREAGPAARADEAGDAPSER